MINIDFYITFLVATALLIIISGPIVSIIIANSLSYATQHGLHTVAGNRWARLRNKSPANF